MCLRFVFLLITRVITWLWLSRREETWKMAEILLLRHQVTVLKRHQACRPKLNWADRALLATLLGVILNARRHGLRLLVTPDTILRWHRDIVRRRWAARSMRGKTGRPATRRNIKALVLRLARENPEWGYRRIHGELAGLGVRVSAPTVWEILKKARIDPAPRRTGPTWSQFLRSQAEAILACDFFSAGLRDGTQAYVLAVIEHAARRIRILGVTLHPTGEWTAQQARNLIMDLGEQAHRVTFMIRDRGSNFTATFDAVLADAEIRTVLCNVATPRMNAIAERWIGDAAANSWTAPSCGTRTICGGSCASTRPTTISTALTARCSAPRRSNRCPNRSILSTTASEVGLAPVARSANIAWSLDVDEVFGMHNTAGVVAGALADAITSLPSQLRRSLTWDQGKEMAGHARFSVATGVPVYFCDPHSPWQRGSNENTNGLLRQYFPRSTDFRALTQRDLDAVAAELNDCPRQTLGWKSPCQALDEALR